MSAEDRYTLQAGDMEQARAMAPYMFGWLNRFIFGGRLPNVPVSVVREGGAGDGLQGLYVAVRFPWCADGAELRQIVLFADAIAEDANCPPEFFEYVAETLLHEMVHHFCRVNGIEDVRGELHTERFAEAARSHGLRCERGAHGWDDTCIRRGGVLQSVVILSRLSQSRGHGPS